MRLRSWAVVAFGAVAVGLIEATLLTLLPSPWREIRPIIDICVILVVVSRSKAGLVFAGIAGFMIDLFSIGSGSFAFARLVVTVAVVALLSITVLTNRSVYATAVLVALARCIDRAWMWLASAVSATLFHADVQVEPLRSFGITLLWDVGIVSACFVALALFTKRFLMTAPFAPRPYDDA